jgi:spermidine/putrescine transport system permease protein
MHYKTARKSLALPFVLFLVLFVIIPILFIIFYAFTDANGNFTFKAIVDFFTSTTKLNVLLVSLLIGVFNTVLCLLISFPLAYLLANPKFNKNYVLVMLFIMPQWINFVLRTGALRDLLSIVLGWFGTTTGEHPLFGTMVGMLINYIPFTVLPLYSTMLKLDHSQIEAAEDLGCNPLQTFIRSIIPQAMPGIISASLMVFMPTISSYVISDTLSEGKIMLFGNSIYLSFSNSDWNGGSFMSLIMLLIIFITMFATRKFQGERDSERGGGSW